MMPIDYDRYSYVRNSPARYSDPTGHAGQDAVCTLVLDGECVSWSDRRGENLTKNKPPQGGGGEEPWQNDPEYNSDTNEPTWGDEDNSDSAWDLKRAEMVWNWICSSGGWWGKGCPGERDLIAWLFGHELGKLLRYKIYHNNDSAARAAMYAITYMRYLFADGIDAGKDLGKFTAFFNPKHDSKFNADDWKLLTKQKPSQTVYDTVDYFWNRKYPAPGRDLVWLTPREQYAPAFTTPLVNVIIPGTDPVEFLLILGLK